MNGKGVLIGIVAVVGLGAAIWFLTSDKEDVPSTIEVEQVDPLTTTSEGDDVGPTDSLASNDADSQEPVVDPYDFGPPLQGQEEADDFLRDAYINKDKVLDELLSRDLVIDKLVAGGEALWRDENPASAWFFWRAPGKMKVRTKDGELFLSEENYKRYDGFVAAVDAIPEEHMMKAYAFLLPLFRAAHERLGNTHIKWDALVPQVMDKIIAMELPDGDIQLNSAGKTYIFTDNKLEKLSPAHKVLIRMGPKHSKHLQDKLARLKTMLPQAEPAKDDTSEATTPE